MTKKTSDFGLRVMTALFGGTALVLLIVYGKVWGSYLLAGVMSFGMMFEFLELVLSKKDRAIKKGLPLVCVPVVFLVSYFLNIEIFILFIMLLFLVFCVYLFLAKGYTQSNLLTHVNEMMFSVYAVSYLVIFPLFLPELRQLNSGLHWVVLFFLMNWFGDSFAYLVGKAIGKHKLYSLISPKKTVEGAVAGTIATCLIAWGYQSVFLSQFSLINVLVLALVVAIVSQLGDLFESLLKRAFKVKDSGNVLPGHGGFLDRFDGVVFSLPVMYTGVSYLL